MSRRRSGNFIPVAAVALLMPTIAGAMTAEQAQIMADQARERAQIESELHDTTTGQESSGGGGYTSRVGNRIRAVASSGSSGMHHHPHVSAHGGSGSGKVTGGIGRVHMPDTDLMALDEKEHAKQKAIADAKKKQREAEKAEEDAARRSEAQAARADAQKNKSTAIATYQPKGAAPMPVDTGAP